MTKEQANLIKTMYPIYRHKVLTLSQNDITDPFGYSLKEYKSCGEQIFEAVKAIVEGL
jgi:protein-tyrosine-phosphatase